MRDHRPALNLTQFLPPPALSGVNMDVKGREAYRVLEEHLCRMTSNSCCLPTKWLAGHQSSGKELAGLSPYRNQTFNVLRVGDELIEILFFPRKTMNYPALSVTQWYSLRMINPLRVLAFKNCGVARRTVAMKQTSFPRGIRQGLERALSKPLQEGLGAGQRGRDTGQPRLVQSQAPLGTN